MGVFIMYCLGTALMSYPEIDEQAIKIMIAREAYPFGFIFVRAIICGICVQMAVDMWNLNATRGGLPVGVHPFLAMLPASAFVLLGCNHCIADLLYVFYSDAFKQGFL
jgi:formate/nitrite transporter FocA (FNT family)